MGGSTNSGSSQSQGFGSSYSQSASLSLPENLNPTTSMLPTTVNSLAGMYSMLGGGPSTNSLLQNFLAPYGGAFAAPVTNAQNTTLGNLGSAETGNYSFNPELGGILQQLFSEAANPAGFASGLANNATTGEAQALNVNDPNLEAMLNPGYAASLATGGPTQSVINAALAPIKAQFNAQTVPGLVGSYGAAGQRPTMSSAFGGAFTNAQAQEQATEAATAGNIVNSVYGQGISGSQNAAENLAGMLGSTYAGTYGTGLNIAANAPGQYNSLTAQEAQNLISTLNAQALPQLTEQLGINNALSTYNSSVSSLLQALGLQVQAEQPAIGYASESASNSGSFQNEESSGQNSGFSFQI